MRRFLVIVLGAATGFAALSVRSPAAPRPPLAPYRVEEDWRFLRDPAQRTAALDPLKFVPLNPAGDVSLTFGGEFRHRWEYYRNDAWGALPGDPNGYHLLRFMLHADLRLGSDWRVFVDVKSGLVEGKSAPVKPPERDDLDLHQAFVEWSPGPALVARVGRQELTYGGMRLLTFREGPNVRQSFDAALVRHQRDRLKIDAFYARPAETNPGVFDDATNDRQLIYGLYGVAPLTGLPGAHLDLYLLGYHRTDARYGGRLGPERRYSAGARFWGHRAALDYNFEAVAQWGDFRDQDIRAWTFASDTGYTFAAAPARPRVYLKANIISGDRAANDGRLGTFKALYPRGAYFGDIGLIGPANLINLHPGVSGRLSARWSFHLDAIFYWRESARDGVYSTGGATLRPPAGAAARRIGTQADAAVTFQPHRHLSFELAYAHFWAGPFLRQSGLAADVAYASALTRFRF